MRLSTLCTAALLAIGSVGIAYASPNLVQNGDFANTSGLTAPSHNPAYTSQQLGYQGFSVDNWTGSGYAIWYPNANDAVNGCGYTEYHYPGSGNGDCSTLNVVGAIPNNGSTFIALDGVQTAALQGSVTQMLSGLTNNAKYTVSFFWGTTQETQASSAQQSHQEFLTVGFGSSSQDTSPYVTTNWDTFQGWFQTSFTFTATGTDQLLSFMASGLPSDGPPMILLTGISVTQNVPEPPELALFGGGLLGLGLLTVFARRRALRRQA
jgi:hypothetical protein